jgi:folate-binding protein YgfZ
MFSPDGYQALRHGAGVLARGDRGVLAVQGPDRLTWLQGLLTNDVAALPVGGVCDAAYLTPQGRMITDLRVVNLAEQTLLDVPGSLAESLRARLDRLLFAEDASVSDLSDRVTIVDLHGPAAPVVRETTTALAHVMAAVADAPFGVPGFSFFVDRGDAEAITAALIAHRAVAVSLETLDVLRVEAGRPAFLVDMDEHTIPLEAGIEDRTISFTKGCYIGQEVIVRVLHRGGGRVAKKLVGLVLATGLVPQRGDTIASDEREVGRVTSAVWSPTLETAIALGYVHRDFIAPGSVLQVTSAAGSQNATVSVLPFVPRLGG